MEMVCLINVFLLFLRHYTSYNSLRNEGSPEIFFNTIMFLMKGWKYNGGTLLSFFYLVRSPFVYDGSHLIPAI